MQAASGEPRARPESGRLPKEIGPYRIKRELGRGASGVVYAVTRGKSERTYALKLIRDLEGLDPQGLARFHREAELSARLKHPGVVGALDAGASGRHRYLVLPLVEGESLHQRLRREGRIPPKEAASLVAQVAEALAAVHGAGVVHRDLKPDNILLDQEQGGAPRITDFGIAREGFGKGSLTQSSAFLGTPAYMAPEQINAASQVDGKADVYSLASVLYECICGVPPFSGATTFLVADQVLNNPPPPFREHVPDVPAKIEELCLRALDKDPSARPDAADFGRSLLEAAAQAPTQETATNLVGLVAAGLGVGLLVLGAIGGALALTSSPDARSESPSVAASPTQSAAPPAADAESLQARLATLEARTLAAEPLEEELVAKLKGLASASQATPEFAGAVRLVLGDYLVRRADLKRAAVTLGQVPADSPARRRAALLRAWILTRLGQVTDASALEHDLLFEDRTDLVGRLLRARRLLEWRQPDAALALLQDDLNGERVDRLVAHVALTTRKLPTTEARGVLERAPTKTDPKLLLLQADLIEDQRAAPALVAQAKRLCTGRDLAPLLGHEFQLLKSQGAPASVLAKLIQRATACEPHPALLSASLVYGELPSEERSALFRRLRREAPTALAQVVGRLEGSGLPVLLDHQIARPFYPSDESWAWARERVERLPEASQRAGHRALVAAIGGALPWHVIQADLERAKSYDLDSGEAAILAAELCVRRGHIAEATNHLDAVREEPQTRRLRARIALYRGHEETAREIWSGIGGSSSAGRLAAVEWALARGDVQAAEGGLSMLDSESVDARLLSHEVAYAKEHLETFEAQKGMPDWMRIARAMQKADPAKRKPILENLRLVQRRLGSLEVRLGVAHAQLELKHVLRNMARRRLGGTPPKPRVEVPLQRAVYYASDANVPCSLYLRGALAGLQGRSQRRIRRSLDFWARLIPDLQEALDRQPPSPILATYFALFDRGARSQALIRSARMRDPAARLPRQLLELVDAQFPARRAEFTR
ncbi:MAG: serine/threonine protein kinase [Planctomycetes bacterium]|nr:serine/threonine protein kinase [Planctomycetota bacterium]